jgi:hypothetical protein
MQQLSPRDHWPRYVGVDAWTTLQGLLGKLLFGELLTLRWGAGIFCMACGTYLISTAAPDPVAQEAKQR